ncbi:MAG: hypothetical protein CR986_04875 [Ignavibacteriae bacterium]|nr:MAG: hypothetical protein CR986_04875 [Ignavibacteriota bacterium]
MNFFIKNIIIIITFIVIVFVNILLLNFPLLNILSYESSALNGILLSFLSGLFWLASKAKLKVTNRIVLLVIFYLLPFFILFLSTTYLQLCPLDDGLNFYLVLTLPSIIVGVAAAEFSYFILTKIKYFIFIVLWLILLFAFLPELIFNPQIYFYNPIFGYYPGVIFDHHIEITNSLILYRLSNILIAAFVIFSVNIKKQPKIFYKTFVITLVLVVPILLFRLKPALSFATDLKKIKNELNKELVTEHFKIILPASLTDKQIKKLKYEHEFYHYQISKQLNLNYQDTITSIIFETGKQKKKLFGANNADVAKPWLNQIYLNYNNYEASLKHEIVHIFSSKLADGFFNIPKNMNPGMIEGFAMAIENDYDGYDIDYLAALAYKNNYKISLESLFSNMSFFANASSLSYIYAGSFFKYLIDNYGVKKFKKNYNNADFKSNYHKIILELEREYYKYLKSLSLENNKDIANYYFGRVPLVKKFCARATARELIIANELFLEGKFQEAYDKFKEIYNYSNSYSALVGSLRCLNKLGRTNEAIKFLESKIDSFQESFHFYFLEFLLADFYSISKKYLAAENLYSKLIKQNPHKIYFNQASLRKDLLNTNKQLLREYINNLSEREKIILELVIKYPSDYSIQLLTNFTNIDTDDFYYRKEILQQALSSNNFSSETYFSFSKFLLSFYEIDEAIKYAKIALSQSDYRSRNIIEEHLTKLNWLKKTSNLNS